MSQINSIRSLSEEGWSVAKISQKMEVDEKTVRKYLAQEDFSPRPPSKLVLPSMLDPYKPQITKWLEEDKASWYKQRHTAKRIHQRLREEVQGFNCSYNTVQRYVKKEKLLLSTSNQRGSLELVWHAGESQADFGEADFIESGIKVRKKYLTLSFPHSNNSFSQVFGGETGECVCHGLKDIFEYIGGVPIVIVFDNAAGVGRKIGEVIQESTLFQKMRAHYGFSVRFCNPNSGHEKGNVENKIGYTRRNLFVPVPAIDNIYTYNRQLLDLHKHKAEEGHYKKLLPIKELFAEDTQALRALPRHPFDVCRYKYIKSDGYGKVRVDHCHYYSSAPEYKHRELLVAIRAHTVDILDEQHQVIVSHTRQFGKQRSDSLDYRTSLVMVTRNPGSWKNCGIRGLVPEVLRELMDHQPKDELQETLKTMAYLTTNYTFETAVQALEEGLRINRTGFCDAAVLAARLNEYGLDTEPDKGPDLQDYDRLFREEGYPV